MPTESPGVQARLRILEGQIRALHEHVGDAGRSCGEVAHLVGVIDGSWRKVRAAVLRGYVEDCLLDVEQDDHVRAKLQAIERIGGRVT